jgi:ferrous iron transport protein A
VVQVTLEKEVGKRLADMGFTAGAEGAIVRQGFLGGPLQVRIRGYDILIRRFEASGIEVKPVGAWSAVADTSRYIGKTRVQKSRNRVTESSGTKNAPKKTERFRRKRG